MSASDMEQSKHALQERLYRFPYHHLVRFEEFDTVELLPWGLEYYAYMKKILNLVLSRNPRSLLDVGCGDGKMILEVLKRQPECRAVGIDLSERAIAFAKAFNHGNGARFFCKPLSEVKDKFEVVTAIETLEHVSDREIPRMADDMHSCLREDGRLIVSVPSENLPVQSKHYRHYNLTLLTSQLKPFVLEDHSYVMRKGSLRDWAVRLSRLSVFSSFRKLSVRFSEKFLFEAGERDGCHLVAVFSKKGL